MIQAGELEQSAPRAAAWLSLQSVRDGAGFAALRAEWNELLADSSAGVFNAWEWLYPWYRRIAADREPMILTARDERGLLVGLMPLCLERRRVAGRVLTRLAFLGETHTGSDYLDAIARRGHEVQVLQAFAGALRDAAGAWDVLDLVDLDQDSPTLLALREAFVGFEVRVTERFTCPGQRFEPGTTFDAFLRQTGRRDNFLRRKKWLEKQPGYSLEVTGAPSQLSAPMAEFFRLHHLRWSADGGSQGIRGPGVESFHRDAAGYLAENGWLRLYTMRVGEEAVASVYGIVHRDRFHYFQSGYDPAWRNKSVGLVLVGETFRDALEGGLAAYDFLRGTETYKSDWTTGERKTVAFRAWPARGRGAWLERAEASGRAVRSVAKRVLPPRLVEQVRRWRRRRSHVS